jgi:molecular chaperone DnaK
VVEGGDAEVISAKTQTLIQASMKLGEAMYAAQQGGEGPASDADAAEAGSDDVVDAEFEEVGDDDHKKSA